MRKIILMALAAFLWKRVKARLATTGASLSTGTQAPSGNYPAGR